MATKSPLAKALKGNQGKLPQQLQDAIKAAPESPAKMKKTARQLEAEKKAKMKADGKKQPLPSMKRDKLTGETPAKQTKGKMKKEVKQIDPNKFTKTYNAATGQSNDTYYNPKKAESYKKNAIAKYGSLEKSREAYSKASKSPAKNYKDGYYGK